MPQSIQSYYPEKTRDAIIANGASLSQAFAVGSGTLVAVVMPAAWTTAVLTFQGSCDGGVTFTDLYDASGNEITVTVAAAQKVLIDHMDGNAYLKIRSGTGGSPVTQGAARTLVAIIKKPTGNAGFL